jgi:hypothetical protein
MGECRGAATRDRGPIEAAEGARGSGALGKEFLMLERTWLLLMIGTAAL